MTDDMQAAIGGLYLVGYLVTFLAMPETGCPKELMRRLILWPLYWAYLVIKSGLALAHQVRK